MSQEQRPEVAKRAASAVVRIGGVNAVIATFVLCAASSTARNAGSGWRVNSSTETRGRVVGFDFVSQSMRASGSGVSSVGWSR